MAVFSRLYRPAARSVLTVRRPFAQAHRFFSASLLETSKVAVLKDAQGNVGAYAMEDVKKGDLVERGMARRLPIDGNVCPDVFTWSTDRSIWASASGCATFYNPALGSANTQMNRMYDQDRFEIHALRDIAKGEAFTMMYQGLEWRDCFKDLKNLAEVHLPPAVQPSLANSLVDCSKVYLKYDAYGGVGAYALQPIKKGELVERGIVRRLPVDGNVSEFVFTWSNDRSVWATGSGCSVYYNASLDGTENTEMIRFLDEDRFEIYALRDIAKDEEVTHLYRSIEWRECFKELKGIRDKALSGEKPPTASSERGLMTEYWTSDHSAPTIENMMLDSDAGIMDRLERPEILSALPSIRGKSVLELGAGIGRFTEILAHKASEVVAVDFVEASCAENRRVNAEHKHVSVVHADVTMLELEQNRFDLVFSNWLLMYLTDDEVRDFAKRSLSWLKPGGHLFFRESCFHASGNTSRRFNPTKYRDPETYAQIFSDAVSEDGSRFQLLATNCVETYGKMKGNVHQMWFRWQKLDPKAVERRRTLLTGQYTPAHCLRYEAIYGRGYIYTGGDAISQVILDSAADCIKPGARVLDIGCGLGGTILYIADKVPGVFLNGASMSSNIISFNVGRHVKLSPEVRQHVNYELLPEAGVPEDELKYPPNSFDAVIIRETLMYYTNQDKAVILQKAQRLLRPGGKVVLVDYCAGKPQSEMSKQVSDHFKEWEYNVMSPEDQKALLERYFQVEDWDATSEFVKYMDEGLERIEENFGPQAPARQISMKANDLEILQEPIKEQIRKTLPSLPDLAAEDGASAAIRQVAMHLETQVAEASACRANYQWARNTWLMERKAAVDGDLKWHFFVGTKA